MNSTNNEKMDSEENNFSNKVRETLEITRSELASVLRSVQPHQWQRAQQLVEQFQPVPWFIWRLSNFVFGQNGRPNKIGEGMVMGLKKVLLAAASDRILGSGGEISKTKDAIKVVRSDVIAATSVIHSISRKIHSKDFSRAWQPILEDAILRAHIGFFVGQMNLDFGPGRGMLAGFAGRVGLAVMIASGSEFQAEQTLLKLAQGSSINEVGKEVYDIDPLQVSAMLLSASGCGKDAAFGAVAYSVIQGENAEIDVQTHEQKQWLASFAITEGIRIGCLDKITEENWQVLGFYKDSDKEDLSELVKMLVRKGHGWDWMT